MNILKEYFDQNKKIFIIIAGIVILTIISFLCLNILSQNTTQDKNDIKPEFLQNDFNLPAPEEVELSSPYLYDFVNGTMGINENLIDPVGEATYIIATKPDSSKLYISYFNGNSGDYNINLFLPAFNSKPIEMYFQNASKLEEFVSKINTDIQFNNVKSATEKDYIFYAIPQSMTIEDNIGYYSNICMDDFSLNQQPGFMQEKINEGEGIPTYIIREHCDLQAIKEVSGIDFNDPFWDNVNYKSNIKVRKNDGTFCVISPVRTSLVAGTGVFVYTYSINGSILPFTVDNVNNTLIKNGYESIEEALVVPKYISMEQASKLEGQNL